MSKMNLDELFARIKKMRVDTLTSISFLRRVGGNDAVAGILDNSKTLRTVMDELQRMDKQIAAMRHDLKNVGCENCAHQDCGNTEEPCKSCGIRELKWEWEGVKPNEEA